MKRAVLVNGIPATGKSTIARAISQRMGWIILTLDTVKEPFFDQLGVGDREFNRALGRASYHAIWSIIRDAPDDTTFIIDAWFGFQPREVLEAHIERAGVGATAEIWCHAPPEVLAKRYGDRLDQRHAGHPGATFIPELIELAKRAAPVDRGPRFDVDTTQATDIEAILAWLKPALQLA